MAETLLNIQNLRVGFQTEAGLLTAVDGISFPVGRGRILGIVGESGSGKSVTAMSILRILPQPSGRILDGEILFEGKDLTKVSLEEMRRIRGRCISMIFQEPMTALNPVHRIGRQMTECLKVHGVTDSALRMSRCLEWLKKVGISAPEVRINDYPHQLSGGMRQRVVIAMALLHHPQLVIADEPTTALDVTIQAQILDLLRHLRKELGTSLILITHDLGVIAEMCDDVAVMYAGRIVEKGPVREIFKNPLHLYTRRLLESIPGFHHVPKSPLPTIEGQVPTLSELRPGCRFALRSGCPYTQEDLDVRPPFVEVAPGHWVEASRVCVDPAILQGIGGVR